MSYDQLRHLADSWGLVMMGVIFLVCIGWTFRPGARQHMDAAANSIFQPETPGDDDHG
ncbi:MAG: cbb3-type cytochrome c oxidase subunit 3 [Polymorphobacter sp.]